jgi:hypothetical protein
MNVLTMGNLNTLMAHYNVPGSHIETTLIVYAACPYHVSSGYIVYGF